MSRKGLALGRMMELSVPLSGAEVVIKSLIIIVGAVV